MLDMARLASSFFVYWRYLEDQILITNRSKYIICFSRSKFVTKELPDLALLLLIHDLKFAKHWRREGEK